MVPVASLLYEKILLVVFEWEVEGERKFALNIRDASVSVELAFEILPPLLLNSAFVVNSLIECLQENLDESGKQTKVICDVLADCGIKEAFEKNGRSMPSPLADLIAKADAEIEHDEISESLPVQARPPLQEDQVLVKPRRGL